MSPDLPTGDVPTRDSILVMIAILETSIYSQKLGGNVIIREGIDESQNIPPNPAYILTDINQTPTVEPAGGDLDRVDESVQIDCYAASKAEMKQLMYEAEVLIENHRTEPAKVEVPGNIFAFLWPGQWVNNDTLSQADGLFRRTQTVTLIRHRGVP